MMQNKKKGKDVGIFLVNEQLIQKRVQRVISFWMMKRLIQGQKPNAEENAYAVSYTLKLYLLTDLSKFRNIVCSFFPGYAKERG